MLILRKNSFAEVKEDLERVMGEIKRGANTIRNSLKGMMLFRAKQCDQHGHKCD